MNKDNQVLLNESNAREGAMVVINKYSNGKLSIGEYAYELISETYINLISQAQSGMCLCVEGKMLDIKICHPHRISNTNIFFNGYRIGKYAINYQQDTPSVTGNYNENAILRISVDGFLIEEYSDTINNQEETIAYSGTFRDITQEGLNILEKCLKFSALNYDLFLDKNLLEKFSKTIEQLDILNDLPLLDNKTHKL